MARTEKDIDQANYVRTEARNAFRNNRFLKEQSHIEKAIDYAKTRIYMCKNYGIAYERMANVTSSGGGEKIVHEGLREQVGNFSRLVCQKMYPRRKRGGKPERGGGECPKV